MYDFFKIILKSQIRKRLVPKLINYSFVALSGAKHLKKWMNYKTWQLVIQLATKCHVNGKSMQVCAYFPLSYILIITNWLWYNKSLPTTFGSKHFESLNRAVQISNWFFYEINMNSIPIIKIKSAKKMRLLTIMLLQTTLKHTTLLVCLKSFIT